MGVVYLPTSIPSFFSFRMKSENHQRMLDQMAKFDVRAAKCTLPEDREGIEQQVKQLFWQRSGLQDSLPQPGVVDDGEVLLQRFYPVDRAVADDPLDRFNEYVRGTLREFVIAQTGDELHVPYRLCLTAFLPMIFYASVNVLGCDNGRCGTSAALMGFSSAALYMAASAISWALFIFIPLPVTYPILLQMMKFGLSYGDGLPQLGLAFLSCPLAFIYSHFCGGFVFGSVFALVNDSSPTQIWIFCLVIAFLLAQLTWLFCGKSVHAAERTPMSCRCIKRQEVAYDALSGR